MADQDTPVQNVLSGDLNIIKKGPLITTVYYSIYILQCPRLGQPIRVPEDTVIGLGSDMIMALTVRKSTDPFEVTNQFKVDIYMFCVDTGWALRKSSFGGSKEHQPHTGNALYCKYFHSKRNV